MNGSMNERVVLLNLFVSSSVAEFFLFTLSAYTTTTSAATATTTATDI